jgi:hypothetical protein
MLWRRISWTLFLPLIYAPHPRLTHAHSLTFLVKFLMTIQGRNAAHYILRAVHLDWNRSLNCACRGCNLWGNTPWRRACCSKKWLLLLYCTGHADFEHKRCEQLNKEAFENSLFLLLRVIKSRTKRWRWHVARMREGRGVYRETWEKQTTGETQV